MPASDIEKYYDDHIAGKVKGFVEKNPRIEKAWETILEFAPNNPTRILELGCGIGDICHRMAGTWKNSQVTGMDISPKSIELASALFASNRLTFVQGILNKNSFEQQFDFILLMDVYEHIAAHDRQELHEALDKLLSDSGTLILTCPTPRYLAYLDAYVDEGIQPVDENITADVVMKLAQDTGTELIKYQEVSIWHPGDYVHIVLKRPSAAWTPESYTAKVLRPSLFAKIRKRLATNPFFSKGASRKAWIKRKLSKVEAFKS